MRIKLVVLLSFFLVPLAAQERMVVRLDEGWRFIKEDITSATDVSLDDRQWQSVRVPHDWAISGPFDLNQDMQFVQVIEDGEKEPKLRTGRTGALPATGVGWYRRKLHLPADQKGKRVYVEFDGVMSNAQVYLNGRYISGRPYGYSSFSLDLTGLFSFGKDNVLAVRVENKPEMSRFYTGAGIVLCGWSVLLRYMWLIGGRM